MKVSHLSSYVKGTLMFPKNGWHFTAGVGQFKHKFQVKGDIAHQNLLVSGNNNDYPVMWCQNIGSKF